MTEERTDARCIRECIWQGRRWRPGETYRGAETPPEHFETLDKDSPADPYEDEKPRSRRKRTPPAETEGRDDATEAGETEKEE